MRALEMSKEEKYRTPDLDNFHASSGWCNRFMNRHGLSLRQRTKRSQKLRKDLDEKVSSSQKFIINNRKKHQFELSEIGNMDETPMTFDSLGNRTVSARGEKTVFVRTTGHEKTHFTNSRWCCHVLRMVQNSAL